MNKSEFVDYMSKTTGFSKTEAEKAINAFTTSTIAAMKAGESIALVGFGTFSISEVAEREGRNPRTGDPILIPARKQPKFSAGKTLKDACNSNDSEPKAVTAKSPKK